MQTRKLSNNNARIETTSRLRGLAIVSSLGGVWVKSKSFEETNPIKIWYVIRYISRLDHVCNIIKPSSEVSLMMATSELPQVRQSNVSHFKVSLGSLHIHLSLPGGLKARLWGFIEFVVIGGVVEQTLSYVSTFPSFDFIASPPICSSESLKNSISNPLMDYKANHIPI